MPFEKQKNQPSAWVSASYQGTTPENENKPSENKTSLQSPFAVTQLKVQALANQSPQVTQLSAWETGIRNQKPDSLSTTLTGRPSNIIQKSPAEHPIQRAVNWTSVSEYMDNNERIDETDPHDRNAVETKIVIRALKSLPEEQRADAITTLQANIPVAGGIYRLTAREINEILTEGGMLPGPGFLDAEEGNILVNTAVNKEGFFEWTQPTDSEFGSWLDNEEPELGKDAKINCWEAVFAMFVEAGLIDKTTLKSHFADDPSFSGLRREDASVLAFNHTVFLYKKRKVLSTSGSDVGATTSTAEVPATTSTADAPATTSTLDDSNRGSTSGALDTDQIDITNFDEFFNSFIGNQNAGDTSFDPLVDISLDPDTSFDLGDFGEGQDPIAGPHSSFDWSQYIKDLEEGGGSGGGDLTSALHSPHTEDSLGDQETVDSASVTSSDSGGSNAANPLPQDPTGELNDLFSLFGLSDDPVPDPFPNTINSGDVITIDSGSDQDWHIVLAVSENHGDWTEIEVMSNYRAGGKDASNRQNSVFARTTLGKVVAAAPGISDGAVRVLFKSISF